MYGSDFYAFPKDDQWETCFTRRPKFVRQFFETSEEHIYAGTPFKGVNLEKSIRDKIYFENAVREFGTPKPVNKGWLRSEAVRILDLSEKHDPFADVDMKFILDNI